MTIRYAEGAKELLAKRGLRPEDVEGVVANAGDDRISDGNVFIAKAAVGDTTVYARYREDGGDAVIEAGYSHKMAIQDIVLIGEPTAWRYCRNGAMINKGHTNLSYLGATRSGPSLVEPTTGESWIEEYLAAGALTTAEGLFQQKRA